MLEKRIQFNNIVYNQFPEYAREEFPLVAEFLSQYYLAQEFQGAPIDLIQNIDKYVKLDEITNHTDSVFLLNDIEFDTDIIIVDTEKSPTGTGGFPKKYGIIKLDNEIITYTGITTNTFTGCIRGFSGISSYKSQSNPDQLVFSTSESENHFKGSTIFNLSSLFLKKFLLKIKYQLAPGFENRTLDKDLNEALFIKQAKDFYISKGTDESFEILFRSLYGEDVSIIRPREYLFRPSDAQYQITKDLVVERVEGNPENLINCTLIQDEYLDYTKAYAPISKVEKIISKNGKEYYKLSIDSNYNKDITFDGSLYGDFKIHPKTKVIGKYEYTPKPLIVTVISNPNTPPPNNVFVIDGVTQKKLILLKGKTYRFDTSNSSNDGHPLKFETLFGENISTLYYSISVSGISGRLNSFVDLTIETTAPNETIKYNCTNHDGMGSSIDITADFIDGITTLDVDSTIGFPNSGELYVTYNDQTNGIINYKSKSINQFFECSNITGIIDDSTYVGINTYARKLPFDGSGESVKVRITSVIQDFDLISNTYNLEKDYNLKIKTLGVDSKDAVSNKWLFNISSSYEVQSVSLIDNSDKTYRIDTKFNHIFKIGDTLKIINSSGIEKDSKIIKIISEKSFQIRGQGELILTDTYNIKRNILKTNSTTFPETSTYSTNIQNIYKNGSKTLVAAPSLPYYGEQSLNLSSRQVIFDGDFTHDPVSETGDTFKIIGHGFYTGDSVYYTPEKIGVQTASSLFNEGIYFIKKIDSDNIKLSLSIPNIYKSKFISIGGTINVKSNKFEFLKFKSKTLKSQKLLREVSSPIDDGTVYKTEPGCTGILINGVEILNYKSTDVVYHGPIKKIEVTSSGSDYDIINPPIINIDDLVGIGATGYCAVKGYLKEIRIIDPGFNYLEVPTIKITGGNGLGAVAKASMKLIDHKIDFNSESTSDLVGIGSTLSIIGFSTYHKFSNAEKVIYITNNQTPIGGLTEDSLYYVSVYSPVQIKLHKTLSDSIVGINTVQLTSNGIGNHQFKSINKKSILGSINIENPGFGYENKKVTISSSVIGINTSIAQINILNHNFQSGEIVKYSTNNNIIGGLTNNEEYYLTKIDDNSFKLSEIGTGSTSKDFYYKTRQFINLTSIGSGIHTFNYPEISVEVIGNVGISSIGLENFKSVVQPIFRGQITSVHLENGGIGYGASEILNYNRQPLITLNSGSSAQVTPIVSNGKIVEVLINYSGNGYNSPPDLKILGQGRGAVLTPIIENGQLIEIKVIESGIGYLQKNTTISITSSGNLAKFDAKIYFWVVNLFEKYFSSISDDDGFISEGINKNFQLQYTHLYAPRKLREILYSSDSEGKTLYGKPDLIKLGKKEITSTDHSPIIGWAYDGNPIYGPYGYSTKQGGIVSQMKSGYKIKQGLDLTQNRPPVSIFPAGFFIEDYTYSEVSDESVLDKSNGRFCVTPEYPYGTYAYFTTVSNDSSDDFNSYKIPEFPYLIGDEFSSKPNEFNFKKSSNQDDIDLNKTKLLRNTNPYNLIESYSSYSYLEIPNQLDQTANIKYASPGHIENIKIISGGSNYKIGDKLIFDNEGTSGYNASAEVESIFGKPISSISVATTSLSNVEFYPSTPQGTFLAFSESTHNLNYRDIINVSGMNTTSSLVEGTYIINTFDNILNITAGIGSTAITGIVTYFSVSGNLTYPNIRENDILGIGTEQVKVLNVDTKSSRIRVIRAINGTVGSSHSTTEILYEYSRKFSINSGFRSQYDYKVNREIYFNPIETVGLGTTSGVGIGTIISFSNPGVGKTQIFIPTRSLYIPDHQLYTGDELIYFTNNGSPIGVSTNGISSSVTLTNQSRLYVAKISDDLIGISTFKVGIGTEGIFVGITSQTNTIGLLHFTNIGTGENHSFKTTYDNLSGNISKNIVTVLTTQDHGLANNEVVDIDINPSISTTFVVRYNDYNKKLLINPRDFISAGINTITNTITITNHKFTKGQKVIHNSVVPAIGLDNNKEYFVVIVDNDNIKLTNTQYDSFSLKPSIIGITSASDGTLSPVNPPIQVYRNSSVIFDLSDSSLSHSQQSTLYPAFNFKFFEDSNFTKIYDNNTDSKFFEVQRVGIVGITSDAKIILSINESTPESLYYNLIPIYDGSLPEDKKLISTDYDIFSNNTIQVNKSQFNGKHSVLVGSSTSFTYNIENYPEQNLYTSNNSILKYKTSFSNSNGAISNVKILNKGQNYYSLPRISSVVSVAGTGAIIEVLSNSIGKIKTTKIKDIGFDFPTDFTIRPNVSIPQVINVDPLASFESIQVISFGKGYTSSPKLIVLDGKTNEIVPEVDLKFTLGNAKIEILENSFALNNTTPTILPIQNSNGVGISSINYNSSTKDVTLTLSVGFSTISTFPFAVNDKILIENISVGIGSIGKGYNSRDYGYQLFTLTSVDENIGGNGSIVYNLGEFLNDSEFPGTFNDINSSGRVIAEKHFPIFNISLKKNNYFIGETVRSESFVGTVEDWNPKTNYVKVLSKNNFNVGKIIIGSSSRTQGIASSITTFDALFNLGPTSKFASGWQSDAGVLNDNLQRVQDSFYYQNFSYSIKSRVDYDTWDDVVSTLNHTSGFKKFSDYQLESNVTGIGTTSLIVKVSGNDLNIIGDIVEVIDLNCVNDFDLVRENFLQIGSEILSDEIIFSSRILMDHSKSIGNRVLSIDDISPQFNSNPRATRFSVVDRFNLSEVRAQKYIVYVRDKIFTEERQILFVTALNDNIGNTFTNQYARVESTYDMGSFDFLNDGTEGTLLFYPTKYRINDFDITTLSYNIDDNLLGIGNTNFGGIVNIQSSSSFVSSGSTTIVGIADTYRAAKVLVVIAGNDNQYEFDELSIIHNGTNVEFLEYGQLTNHSQDSYSSSGLGTYYSYLSDSQLKVDFIPNVGIAATINTIQVAFASTTIVGVGTYDMEHARLEGRSTSIASTSTPSPVSINQTSDIYDAIYYIVQISDNTNNIHQLSEISLIKNNSDILFTEYANVNTFSGIGTIGAQKISSFIDLTFTPLPNISVDVKVYSNALRCEDYDKDTINFLNSKIQTNNGFYNGTETDIKREFVLKHKNLPIFERIVGSASTIVNTVSNTIHIPDHFFVTGELINYFNNGTDVNDAIGIASTSFAGIGVTDKLPQNIYVVKVDQNNIKLSRSAEDALSFIPKTLDINSNSQPGISHRFVSTNQNSKVIVAIDNLIQSPVVSTSVTTKLATNFTAAETLLYFDSTTSFFSGDLIKIDNEILKIENIGIGSTNSVRVRRPWLGTGVAGYSTNTLVTKVTGNYNIVNNIINFVEAPYGNIPFSSITNRPDERDWTDISTGSKFQGRSFIRSGIIDSSEETYHKNYILDDISSDFDGKDKTFTLKSNNTNVTDIYNKNAVILINDIFQMPGLTNDYSLSESSGITSITFTGAATSISYDVNNATIPRGGIIVSVGSTEGFGYQPLVSAGGTVVVSSGGTISSISIGNSGSGYRTSANYQILLKTSSAVGIGSTIIFLQNENSIFGILNLLNTGSNCNIGVGTYILSTSIVSIASTFIRIGVGNTSAYSIPSGTSVSVNITNPQIGIVNVGVANSSVGVATVTHIGFTTIISGRISSSVSITNPGTGYTSTNPPYVIFDDPKSYEDIPLIYSSGSSGFGTEATINIVVGQGSSIIDFEIKNIGYGYNNSEILTIPIVGAIGIPTTGISFKEFQISIQKTFDDKFTGWSIGELQVLDRIDSRFDGKRISFPISLSGNLISIISPRGSNINIQDTLLIFINDVLQVPGEGYVFTGGSIIRFTEPPKVGDTSKIIFYRGSGSVDVVDVDILETVKVGDELTIGYDSFIGQSATLQEDERVVTSINSIDLVETNPYFGPGNVIDENLERPVKWCRQTEDKIINEQEVNKDRILYEAVINPISYLIQPVGIGSTILRVDNVRPFFNPFNEDINSLEFQKSITIISQDNKIGASATAVVSIAGTISSIVLSDGGSGYTAIPSVSIQNSVGIGTTLGINATASSSISSNNVTNISIINAGVGYTISNPPLVLIESPNIIKETNVVNLYAGDSGVIVGFGTTTISGIDNIILDLYIPADSYLRDSSIVQIPITISSIDIGDYFLVYNSNVGFASTEIVSRGINNDIIGIGTDFINNVYQVNSANNIQTNIVGIGTTSVKRIFAKITGISTINFASNNIYFDSNIFTFDSNGIGTGGGYSGIVTTSNNFGNFSWGRIELKSRTKQNNYNFYGNNGIGGISTSGVVKRNIPLKFKKLP